MASLSPYYAKCGPRTSSIAWELVEMQNLRHHPDLPGQDLHLCACSSSRGAALDRSPPPATAGPTLPPPQRDFLRGALLLFTPLPPHRNIISSGMGSYLIFINCPAPKPVHGRRMLGVCCVEEALSGSLPSGPSSTLFSAGTEGRAMEPAAPASAGPIETDTWGHVFPTPLSHSAPGGK